MYPIDGSASASANFPDFDEVKEFMQSLLPSPVEVLTNAFFRSPLFALVTFFKIADFYGCIASQDPLYDQL